MSTARSFRPWRRASVAAGVLFALGLGFGTALFAAGASPAAAASGPTTTVPAAPTTTVAPLSTIPIAPTTRPLAIKPQSAHVSGVFVVLCIVGFGVVVLMMLVQVFLTRPGRERRGAGTL